MVAVSSTLNYSNLLKFELDKKSLDQIVYTIVLLVKIYRHSVRSSVCDVSESVPMTTDNWNRNGILTRKSRIEIVREIIMFTHNLNTGKFSKHLLFGHSVDNADSHFPYSEMTAVKVTF